MNIRHATLAVMEYIHNELDGWNEAIGCAYESLNETRASVYMELGRDFTYQSFPETIWISKANRRVANLERVYEKLFPVHGPTRDDYTPPLPSNAWEAPF